MSAPPTPDDLAVMSFGDHLEELRTRILRSLLVAGVGTVFALIFQDSLLRTITRPHRQVMEDLAAGREADRLAKELTRIRESLQVLPLAEGARAVAYLDELVAWRTEWDGARDRLSAESGPGVGAFLDLLERRLETIDHLESRVEVVSRLERSSRSIQASAPGLSEERRSVRRGLEAAAVEAEEIGRLIAGWKEAAGELPANAGGESAVIEQAALDLEKEQFELRRLATGDLRFPPLGALSYTDPFIAHLKVSFLAGLILALPWITFELWAFVGRGLYTFERRAIYPFIPLSMVGLVLGGLFAYFVLIPVGLGYLGGYGSPDVVGPAFTLREYLSLVFTLLLGMGLVFQLPLLMVFLARAGVSNPKVYREYRKFSIIGALIAGSILTPPDLITQLLMAGPLILLYESGILASEILGRRRAGGEEASA